INFVVLTAALSSCNGGLFSTGRMLYTLAQQKKAPERFGRAMVRMAKVWAAAQGRHFVLHDDIKLLARPVWQHRLL
ncbi:hypothetical protein R0K17_32510, partial [Planococcus sp. SIMBA_143]